MMPITPFRGEDALEEHRKFYNQTNANPSKPPRKRPEFTKEGSTGRAAKPAKLDIGPEDEDVADDGSEPDSDARFVPVDGDIRGVDWYIRELGDQNLECEDEHLHQESVMARSELSVY
jgi:hypothetical protein